MAHFIIRNCYITNFEGWKCCNLGLVATNGYLLNNTILYIGVRVQLDFSKNITIEYNTFINDFNSNDLKPC